MPLGTCSSAVAVEAAQTAVAGTGTLAAALAAALAAGVLVWQTAFADYSCFGRAGRQRPVAAVADMADTARGTAAVPGTVVAARETAAAAWGTAGPVAVAVRKGERAAGKDMTC